MIIELRPDQIKILRLLIEQVKEPDPITAMVLTDITAALDAAKEPDEVEPSGEFPARQGRRRGGRGPVPRSTPNWTPAEDTLLLGYRHTIPIPWDEITQRLPRRSEQACKARLFRLLEKEPDDIEVVLPVPEPAHLNGPAVATSIPSIEPIRQLTKAELMRGR